MNTIIYTLALTAAQNLELPPLAPIPPIPRANCNAPNCQNPISNQETPYQPLINTEDILYSRNLAQSLRAAKNKQMIEYALTANDPRVKAAANQIALDYGTDYIEDLITNIADTDIIVQQTARTALIYTTTLLNTQKTKPLDFGPTATSNSQQVTNSQTLWKLWYNSVPPEQKQKINSYRKITVDKIPPTPGIKPTVKEKEKR